MYRALVFNELIAKYKLLAMVIIQIAGVLVHVGIVNFLLMRIITPEEPSCMPVGRISCQVWKV